MIESMKEEESIKGKLTEGRDRRQKEGREN
jgi:hypothetical protein